MKLIWTTGAPSHPGFDLLASDIVDASFSLEGQWGDSQSIEVRRVLQPWWDFGRSSSS